MEKKSQPANRLLCDTGPPNCHVCAVIKFALFPGFAAAPFLCAEVSFGEFDMLSHDMVSSVATDSATSR